MNRGEFVKGRERTPIEWYPVGSIWDKKAGVSDIPSMMRVKGINIKSYGKYYLCEDMFFSSILSERDITYSFSEEEMGDYYRPSDSLYA